MSLLVYLNDDILMPAKLHPVSSLLAYRVAFTPRARFESQQEGSQPAPSQKRRACAAHCFCPGRIILCSNLRLGIPFSSPVFVSLWRQHIYHQFSESPQTSGKNLLWSIFSRGVAMYLECVGFLRSFRIQLAHCTPCPSFSAPCSALFLPPCSHPKYSGSERQASIVSAAIYGPLSLLRWRLYMRSRPALIQSTVGRPLTL